MIVPYAPGASTDTVARLVARHMGDYLKQSIVVENRSGAGGTTGTGEVARSPADGYTILLGNLSTLVLSRFLFRNLNYVADRDLVPVFNIALIPNILVINRDVPASNLREFIAYLKASPGRHSFGSAGQGTIMHLSGELFQRLAGVEMIHVPYRGSQPGLQDLIAGNIVMMFDNVPGTIGLVQSNAIRPIGVSTEVRVPALPSVPTISESGLPEFVSKSWFAVCIRAGTPAATKAKLEAAGLYAMNHPETKARLIDLGAIPASMNGSDTEKFVRSEVDYWETFVKSMNITLD
ncbi:Bug family tripartite tricarboxylate transporter substrate binding protein [Bradyrhizobium vignae]|uniref:Tripartite tricarboxylate transporter substrate binding protein n=1 Tax=Bradyrhizobium vignae TaxID=1549949 RepID=A0A2U3PUS3_9BRAD|nr:tripartite tricarboxylate transporter substrate binding protein [Bradyrhizobium vignae]SPP92902.1 conserved protein of unknown function [Bradyrhizobium vignae]